MLLKLIKKILVTHALLSYITITHAITMPVAESSPSMQPTAALAYIAPKPSAPSNTNAISFAIQAGKIAGVVQACGQDVSIFTNRVNEALNKLANSSADKVLALQAFQEVMRQAQIAEQKTPLIPCADAIKDYKSLPLMRDDYQQMVLPQLNPTMGGVNNPSAPSASIPNSSTPNQTNIMQNNSNVPTTTDPGQAPSASSG